MKVGSQRLGRSKKLVQDTIVSGGRKSVERRIAGVGFAIKTELVGKLSALSKDINDCVMTLRP